MLRRALFLALTVALATACDPDEPASDAGAPDAAVDAGGPDAAIDGGADASADGGSDAAIDAGADAGVDGGPDAAIDAGPDNQPPSAPAVSLPAAPTTDEPLQARIDAEAVDPDGDPIRYRYAWLRDGQPVATTTSSVPAALTARGEAWRVEVVASDGLLDGPVATATTAIVNAAPTLAGAAIAPRSVRATTATVTCAGVGFADPDGDPAQTRFAWTVDGTPAGTGPELAGIGFVRGSTIACAATPFDGLDAGPAVVTSTVVDNSRPIVVDAEVRPVGATTVDTLTCTSTTSDADGDPVTVDYEWEVSSQPGSGVGQIVGTGPVLAPSAFERGFITCRVTPRDLLARGIPFEVTVRIDNAPPTVNAVSIAPTSPRTTADLTCSATGSDPDGDPVSFTYVWAVDGAPAGVGSTLAAAATARGETVRCTATPTDGTDAGAPSFAERVIGNTPPVLQTVSVTPPAPRATDELTCAATGGDVDADPVSFGFAWFVNGAAAGTGPVLPAAALTRGDAVECTATPTDGTDVGAPGTALVTVRNTPPTLASAAISPSSPGTDDPLTCAGLGAQDADGDAVSILYQWTVNGVGAGTAATLGAAAFSAGDAVTCAATPDDGTDTGPPRSDSVTIQNTPPTAQSVTITPPAPRTADSLTCAAVGADIDGDAVTFSYAWTVDGVAAGMGASLPAAAIARGDSVVCTATPNDGSAAGAPATALVTVANTPPTLASAAIAPAAPRTDDNLACTGSGPQDADGDSVSISYAWTVNGAPGGAGPTLPAAAFSAGDSVTCTATPNDGLTDGAAQTDTAIVQNTPPTVASVTITPPAPTTTADLVCAATGSDVDGDTVTFTYAWTVNGVAAGAGSGLAAGAFARGDAVACAATPNDGAVDGAPSTAQVPVVNSPPTISAIALSPSPLVPGGDVTCAPTTDDADGDTVTVTYAWRVNGASVGTTAAVLPGAGLGAGDSVECTATPSDGTDAGAPAVASGAVPQPPPTVSIAFPPARVETDEATITLRGTATNAGSVQQLEVNGVAATTSSGWADWQVTVPLVDGPQTLRVDSRDTGGGLTPDLDRVQVVRGTPVGFSDMVYDAPNRRFFGIQLLLNPTRYRIVELNRDTGARVVISDASASIGAGADFGRATRLVLDATRGQLVVLDEGRDAFWTVALATGNRTIVSQFSFSAPIGAGPRIRQPRDLALDAAGARVLVTDNDEDGVFSVDLLTGDRVELSTDNVGSGPTFSATGWIGYLAATGEAVVFDTASERLFRVDLTTGVRTQVPEPSNQPNLSQVEDMVLDPATGSALLVQRFAGQVLRADLGTGVRTVVSSGFDQVGAGVSLSFPRALARDAASGRLFVSDNARHALIEVNETSGDRSYVAPVVLGSGPNLSRPLDVVLDPTGAGRVLIWDSDPERVLRLDLTTGDRTEVLDAEGALTFRAHGLAVDPTAGTVYLHDSSRDVVRWTVPPGVPFLWPAGGGVQYLGEPQGMVLDVSGNRLLLPNGGTEIEALNLSNGVRTPLTSLSVGSGAAFSDIEDFALEPSGTSLVAVDDVTPQVFRIALSNGARTVVTGAGVGSGDALGFPNGVAVDPTTADIYAVRGSVVRVDPLTGARTERFGAADRGQVSCGDGAVAYEPSVGVVVRTCADQSHVLLVDPETRQQVIFAR